MNNKTYIFLTFAIFGIGGTQIYIRNKTKYLQNAGWNVCVISTEPGEDIIIKDLYPYKDGVFNQIVYNPYLYSHKERERIIDEMVSYINKFSNKNAEIVIESNFIAVSPWGEILAEKLNAKHLVLLIQEDYNLKVDSYRRFLDFKLKRGELAANTEVALRKLFDGYRMLNDNECYKLNPHCNNSIDDCDSVIGRNLPKADYYIGSFGRVNKPFVLPMVDSITSLAIRHPEKSFHLVLFGWTDNPSDITYIEHKTKETSNLTFQVTGPIYPLPKCDAHKMNVFVSTSGAAWSTYMEGCLTISIDDNDLKPIGVLGYTAHHALHRVGEEIIELDDLLEQVLLESRYAPIITKSASARVYTSFDFKDHDDFILRSSNTIEYYSIRKLRPSIFGTLYFRWKHRK